MLHWFLKKHNKLFGSKIKLVRLSYFFMNRKLRIGCMGLNLPLHNLRAIFARFSCVEEKFLALQGFKL